MNSTNEAQSPAPGHENHAHCGFSHTGAAARDRDLRNHRLQHFAAIRTQAAKDLAAVEDAKEEASSLAQRAADAGTRLAAAVQTAKASHHEFTQAVQVARDEGRAVDVDDHMKRAAALLA